MDINLNDEDLFTCIAGAGSFSYGWYLDVDVDWPGLRLKVTLDNGNDGRESATLTPGAMRRAVPGAAAMCWNVNGVNWSDPECDSDVDADVADCVIQYAVLGDVIFG